MVSYDKIISEVILKRRSIRSFKDATLPEGFDKELIEVARWAPNAGNAQPWKFYIIKDNNVKSELSKAAYSQAFVAKAPLVIVVAADLQIAKSAYGSRGMDLYCFQDTAAAVQNMLLYAASKGIGSCWVGAFNESSIAGILKCKSNEKPVAIIPFGYPNTNPSPPPRKFVDAISVVIDTQKKIAAGIFLS